MEPNQPPKNGLEIRRNKMEEVSEKMRRYEAQMQRLEQLRQEERKRWREECKQLQEVHERLLIELTEKSKPKITETFVPSPAVRGNTSNFCGNRTTNAHALPDRLKDQLINTVRPKRRITVNKRAREREAKAADEAARALDILSISEQTMKPSSSTCPFSPPSFQDRLKERFDTYERRNDYVTKLRQMQRLLSAVLHLQTCEHNRVGSLNCLTCNLPVASDTRVILKHMRTCTVLVNCPMPKCSLAREVFDHYQKCTTNGCKTCLPARREPFSTQEHLRRFINTIGKGVDEEVPMETSSAPTIFPPGLSRSGLLRMPRLAAMSFARRTEAQAEETSAEMKMED